MPDSKKSQNLTPYKCGYCPESFIRNLRLVNHMKLIHETQQCKHCTKTDLDGNT